jgi:hypothetical protein
MFRMRTNIRKMKNTREWNAECGMFVVIQEFAYVACVSIALILTSTSYGGMVSLEARFQGHQTLTTGEGIEVYHLYLSFDEVVQVFIVWDIDFILGGDMYQYTTPPFNPPRLNSAPNSNFFQFAPDLQWDTFLTIGDRDSADGSDIAVDSNWVFGTFGPDVIQTPGGWFDSNPATQDGLSDINNDVFIAQITLLTSTLTGADPFRGAGRITYNDVNSITSQALVQSANYNVPAPGTGFVLLTGLGAIRRRRRADEEFHWER